MKKRRALPSSLMVSGFILLILCACALPSAAESSRFIVVAGALGSTGTIVAGLIVAVFFRSRFGARNSQKANDKRKGG
jgi:hypothetical protein